MPGDAAEASPGPQAVAVLGDYWLPDRPVRSEVGALVQRARDRADAGAASALAALFSRLADSLPPASASAAGGRLVAAVPSAPSPAGAEPSFQLSFVLARALADAGAGLLCPGLIMRRRGSPKMREVPPRERPAAAARAGYEVRRAVTGRHVVLVDDVILTGATLREVTARLTDAGAASVVAAAAARTRLG